MKALWKYSEKKGNSFFCCNLFLSSSIHFLKEEKLGFFFIITDVSVRIAKTKNKKRKRES